MTHVESTAHGRALGAAFSLLSPFLLSLGLAAGAVPDVHAAPPALAPSAGDGAAAAAVAPKAYIGLFKDNAVGVLDTAANRMLTTIPVPAGPHGMVVSPDGDEVFVSSDGAATVSVIDTATDKVEASVDVGQAPHGLAMTPDGHEIWAAVFGTSQVAVIDAENYEVLAQIPVPQPHNIAISPDGKTAYVAAQQPGATALAVLDVAGRVQTGTVPLDKTPRALSFDPTGTRLYFTLAGADAVQVLDPSTNQIVDSVPVGASPHLPLLNPTGNLGMVVSQGPGELDLFDPASDAVDAVVPVGTLPHWIALADQGKMAYVTNEGSNDVSVVDLASDRVTATIPVGNAPRKIVVQPSADAGAATPAPAATTPTRATPPAPAVAPTAAPSAAGAAPGGPALTIAQFAFSPAKLTVAPGQTITWTNVDAVRHNVTSDGGAWTPADLDRGQSFSVVLTQPGTYTYHCAIHPFMTGTIEVRA